MSVRSGNPNTIIPFLRRYSAMKIKTVATGFALVMCSALLTATLVVSGMQFFPRGEKESQEGSAFTLFKPKETPRAIQYFEVKNQVVTLKGRDNRERYLLLDLAYVVDSDAAMEKTERALPKLKSVLVGMFSGMDYAAARAMSVDDIHLQLMTRYEGAFGKSTPFTDVIISKMVFQ